LIEALRIKGYAYSTEKSYVDWIKRYINFHAPAHPASLGAEGIRAFVASLAARDLAPSTRNQALGAVLFLYRHVLRAAISSEGLASEATRDLTARPDKRIPTVLSRDEIQRLFSALPIGASQLIARLLYGTGLRVSEGLGLRVKDIDFDQNQIIARDTKGNEDRVTMLPSSLVPPLRQQLDRARQLHAFDLAHGHGQVDLPGALRRKYPNADAEWHWQYVFPSERLARDPRDPAGPLFRHHLHESGLQRAIHAAARLAGINKLVGPQTLRHSFATHLLEAHYDIRTVQTLLGHKDVKTTMIYTHVLRQGAGAVRSPLDALPA